LQRFGQVLMKKMYLLLQKLSYKFTNRNYKIKVLTEYTFRAKYFSANHFYVCFFLISLKHSLRRGAKVYILCRNVKQVQNCFFEN